MTKRKNIKRIAANRWQIRFAYKDPLTGRERRVKRVVEGTILDAERERDRLKVAAHAGTLDARRAGASSAAPTLADWFEPWMEHREHRDRVAASTLREERIAMASKILPAVGAWRPEAIEIHHLDQLFARWQGERKPDGSLYSGVTIRNRASLLLKYLRWVCKRIGRPSAWLRDVDTVRVKGRGRRGRALSADEIRAFLPAFEVRYPQHYALVFVLFATGQRFGSVTALRWEDVAFNGAEGGVITFARAHTNGDVHEGNKTGDVNTVPFGAALAAALRDHRKRMIAEQHPGLATGLVFPAAKPPAESASGGFRTGSALRGPLRRTCEAIGIPRFTVHDLRRTLNTLLVEQDVQGTIVRDVLGHRSAAMTDHYARISDDAKGAALARVVELVK